VEGRSARARGTAARLFPGLARTYDRTVAYATLFQDRYWKRWVAERAPDERGFALDIGCGTLIMEERMRARKTTFVGLDLTEAMLREGQAKSLANVALMTRGDAEALPFPDETFDLVISCYVIKYVEVKRFADEVARVARPGATVVIYDFVRPRGIWAPFLELYLQAGIRAVGLLFELAGKESAFTFRRLPEIVAGSVWEREFVEAMKERGFKTVAAEKLTGGVVFAYSGKKERRQEA
jgi:demethylmenaquinone methyltransferase/2-methoxy-6-polyprenyl-1,4-benzoquinol methylase